MASQDLTQLPLANSDQVGEVGGLPETNHHVPESENLSTSQSTTGQNVLDGDQQTTTHQDREAGQTNPPPSRLTIATLGTVPGLQLEDESLTSLTFRSRLLDRFPLNSSALHRFPSPSGQPFDIAIVSHRRSAIDVSAYRGWIDWVVEVCIGFPSADSSLLSAWTRLGPNGITLCQPPLGTRTPRIILGHLFAAEVFGNEHAAPLFYIQIVQGVSDAVKVLVLSSRAELMDSAYAEACSGYSTTFIGAVCQGVRAKFLALCSSPQGATYRPVVDMARRNIREAVSMAMENPMTRIGVIY